MVTSIYVDNFKCLRNAKIIFDNSKTLIYSNVNHIGVGRTALVQAIYAAKQIALGNDIDLSSHYNKFSGLHIPMIFGFQFKKDDKKFNYELTYDHKENKILKEVFYSFDNDKMYEYHCCAVNNHKELRSFIDSLVVIKDNIDTEFLCSLNTVNKQSSAFESFGFSKIKLEIKKTDEKLRMCEKNMFLKHNGKIYYIEKNKTYELVFVHFCNENKMHVSYDEECNGIKKTLEYILMNLTSKKTYFVDDFDVSMHPLLVKHMIYSLDKQSQFVLIANNTIMLDFLKYKKIIFADRINGESIFYKIYGDRIKDDYFDNKKWFFM